MPGLVLEGGTFRPVFSCGVMDALLDNDIMFDYVIGVSAGITYAASYLSRQRERNINILRQYRGDKRYFGARNLLHDHSIFGTDFVFDTIPNQLVPFDWDEFHKYQGKYLVMRKMMKEKQLESSLKLILWSISVVRDIIFRWLMI